MQLASGIKGFAACSILAVIMNFINGQLFYALQLLVSNMDAGPSSPLDTFSSIQSMSWLVGWIPVLIFVTGLLWLIASIFRKEPGEGMY